MVVTDSDGREVKAGDTITFSYGVPPVGVIAPVVEKDGLLIALTPDHKPREMMVHRLRRHVGEFYTQNRERHGLHAPSQLL